MTFWRYTNQIIIIIIIIIVAIIIIVLLTKFSFDNYK